MTASTAECKLEGTSEAKDVIVVVTLLPLASADSKLVNNVETIVDGIVEFIIVPNASNVAVMFLELSNNSNTGDSCAFSAEVILFKVIKDSVVPTGSVESANKVKTALAKASELEELLVEMDDIKVLKPSKSSVVFVEVVNNSSRAEKAAVVPALVPAKAIGANFVRDDNVVAVSVAWDNKFNRGDKTAVEAIALRAPKIVSTVVFGAVKAEPKTVKTGPTCGTTLVTLIFEISASPM